MPGGRLIQGTAAAGPASMACRMTSHAGAWRSPGVKHPAVRSHMKSVKSNRSIHNFPFAPARWPFFYGWVVLLGGTVGIIFSSPGQTIGVSAFTEPLIEALRVDRMALSLAYGVGTVASGLALTFAGRLYDRIGARWSSLVAAWGLGITLLGLSRMTDLLPLLSAAFNGRYRVPLAIATLAVGFFFLRFFGQGLLTISSRNMVMQWFVHRRGLANGLMGVFIGLAFSSTPPIFNRLIQRFTWQGAWQGIGWATAIGFAAFVFVFFRDQPESCGLLPDGGRSGGRHDPIHQPAVDFTLKQAVRTRGFWIFTLALSMASLYGTAFAFHVESMLGQAGYSPAQAYGVFFPAAVISVTLGLAAGWISDHIKLKYLLLVMLSGMAVSMSGLIVNLPRITYLMVVIGNGLNSAMMGVLMGVHCARFFGRRHLGEVSGFQMTFNVLASAVGPALFAFSLRVTGSYLPVALGCLIGVAGLFAAAFRADPPFIPNRPRVST